MTNAKDMWDKWNPDIHLTEDSKKRIVSAAKATLTPIEVNKDDCFAYFQGGHGRYETFLDFCPCRDFQTRKLPCKHIYRLAMEIGVIDGTPMNDPTKIKIPRVKGGLELIPALDIIEKCTDETQYLAYQLFSLINNDGKYKCPTYVSPETNELLLNHIFHSVIAMDDSLKDEILNEKEIISLLKNKGCDVGVRKTNLETAKSLCREFIPGYLEKQYANIIVLELEDRFSNVKQKIFRYLKRKYKPDLYFDENMNQIAYYPDDEITTLLISRGMLIVE